MSQSQNPHNEETNVTLTVTWKEFEEITEALHYYRKMKKTKLEWKSEGSLTCLLGHLDWTAPGIRTMLGEKITNK